ncbi:hypothetical protein L249_7964 [Ophiocordyceps polyrhachis-furcata BCC 54312]|uniref:Uncharacterized protein n=1 Tax=Ophiocordyceps polyrhachis-furcata BCC 54312 TaxID=1330021 RepID=A0A367LHJ3_9HYPO|nr:hypothetical protein L249_7964 [Ophiocordyceps polyrhachis-furcata BCC 54312]
MLDHASTCQGMTTLISFDPGAKSERGGNGDGRGVRSGGLVALLLTLCDGDSSRHTSGEAGVEGWRGGREGASITIGREHGQKPVMQASP